MQNRIQRRANSDCDPEFIFKSLNATGAPVRRYENWEKKLIQATERSLHAVSIYPFFLSF